MDTQLCLEIGAVAAVQVWDGWGAPHMRADAYRRENEHGMAAAVSKWIV